MKSLIKIISVLIMIKNSVLQPNLGECGNFGYRAINFDSCKGKATYDPTNYYCCFLKAGKYQECVEVLKKDIDDNAVKMTILEIQKGIYKPWYDNNGYDLNQIYEKLQTFECDNCHYLTYNQIFFFIIILLIIF